ncbi:MAG: SIS domain-containing protein [Phycisphaerales bacterium]|jgi:D-sedoheptulose 7-phosphate isomerase|nr:SIS domain-containing protein [Phycisphaerae bacterium]MBT6165494.1 SIS domain-containing protein [Phycisphaerae bacterium]MBT7658609.1 SIS domain-containing protein [Phycisphaerae bacterium]MDE1037538.1 SIS domain-containing protein [Phycisphaerales bacterium]|tara:strand:- start:2126 stop:2758 length:633 start_codon:yes stop_codon:yes gene_type:complete
MNTLITQRLDDAAEVIEALREATDDIALISSVIIDRISNGGTIMAAGNGGSAAQAMHFCEELTGRYRETRPALPAICLCSDAAAMSCIANDFGWENVFMRQLEAHASFTIDDEDEENAISNDVLLVLSTSGNSANVNTALECANELGIVTIGLLGKDGGGSADLCDHCIVIDATDSAAIQDGHQVVLHAICEVIEAWVAEEMANETEEVA